MNKPLPKLERWHREFNRDGSLERMEIFLNSFNGTEPIEHIDAHITTGKAEQAKQAKQAKRYAKHPFAICLDAGLD